jgi:hypothetical protein
MSREAHVRFWESGRVKSPPATHPFELERCSLGPSLFHAIRVHPMPGKFTSG